MRPQASRWGPTVSCVSPSTSKNSREPSIQLAWPAFAKAVARKNNSMSEPLRVLFVDDSEKDVFLLLRELRKGGFEPQHKRVDDAASLRAILQSEEWQIVISDFHMPNFDGLMALQIFKEAGDRKSTRLNSSHLGISYAVF